VRKRPSEAVEHLRWFCGRCPQCLLRRRRERQKKFSSLLRLCLSLSHKLTHTLSLSLLSHFSFLYSLLSSPSSLLTFYRINHSALLACELREVLEDLVDLNHFPLEVANLIVTLDDDALRERRDGVRRERKRGREREREQNVHIGLSLVLSSLPCLLPFRFLSSTSCHCLSLTLL
jgi:hypothetical protein